MLAESMQPAVVIQEPQPPQSPLSSPAITTKVQQIAVEASCSAPRSIMPQDGHKMASLAMTTTRLAVATQLTQYQAARKAHLRALFENADCRAEVDGYLQKLVHDHAIGDMSMGDIEADVRRRFGVSEDGVGPDLGNVGDNSPAVDACNFAMVELQAKLHQKAAAAEHQADHDGEARVATERAARVAPQLPYSHSRYGALTPRAARPW